MMFAAAIFVGCGMGGADESATGVAEAFYEQMAAGDVEAAKKLSTPETAAMLDYIAQTHCPEMFHVIAEGGASDADIGESTARVRFIEGGGFSTVPVAKIDRKWKVDFATMMKAHSRPEPVLMTL